MTFEFVFTVRWGSKTIRSHDHASSKEVYNLLQSLSLRNNGLAPTIDVELTPPTFLHPHEQHATLEFQPTTHNAFPPTSFYWPDSSIPLESNVASYTQSYEPQSRPYSPTPYDSLSGDDNFTDPFALTEERPISPPLSHLETFHEYWPYTPTALTPLGYSTMTQPVPHCEEPALQRYRDTLLAAELGLYATSPPWSYAQDNLGNFPTAFCPCHTPSIPPFHMQETVTLDSSPCSALGVYLDRPATHRAAIDQRPALVSSEDLNLMSDDTALDVPGFPILPYHYVHHNIMP